MCTESERRERTAGLDRRIGKGQGKKGNCGCDSQGVAEGEEFCPYNYLLSIVGCPTC